MIRTPTSLARALLRRGLHHRSASVGGANQSQVPLVVSGPMGPTAHRHRFAASAMAKSDGGRSTSTVSPDKQRDVGKQRKQIDLQPPKGTRDFPPEEMRVRNWLFGHF